MPVPPRSLLAATLVVLAAITLVPLATPSPAAGAGQPIRLGVSSPNTPGTTLEERVTGLENYLGEGQFGAIRLYHAWDDWFPHGHEQFLLDPARDTLPVLSIDTVRLDGSRVYWRNIAEAPAGSILHSNMIRWAEDLKAFGRPIVVSLNHEPDFYQNGGTGSSYWYKKAYEKLTWILRNRGADNVRTAFIGVAWNFDPRSDVQAEDWYPGDHWVDVIGVDGYNWGDCRNPNGPWRSLDDVFDPFLAWADNHPDKALMLAEFGVAEDYDYFGWRKRNWIRDATAGFEDPKWDRLEIITWWDNIHTPDTGCDFRVRSSNGSRVAFREMMQSPRFGG